MKIGIFGDSFAYCFRGERLSLNKTLAWPEILNLKYHVDNYAMSGTSLLYSAKKFYKHQDEYDKIIFVVTHPGRFEFNEIIQNLCDKNLDWHHYKRVQGFTSTEKNFLDATRDKTLDPTIVKACETAYNYFLYINNKEDDDIIQSLILNDIKSKRNDVILIPAFETSFPDQGKVPAMEDIYKMENLHWQIKDPGHTYRNDIRLCHMTEENNEIFADNVIKWLSGDSVTINLEDYKRPTSSANDYFI